MFLCFFDCSLKGYGVNPAKPWGQGYSAFLPHYSLLDAKQFPQSVYCSFEGLKRGVPLGLGPERLDYLFGAYPAAPEGYQGLEQLKGLLLGPFPGNRPACLLL